MMMMIIIIIIIIINSNSEYEGSVLQFFPHFGCVLYLQFSNSYFPIPIISIIFVSHITFKLSFPSHFSVFLCLNAEPTSKDE